MCRRLLSTRTICIFNPIRSQLRSKSPTTKATRTSTTASPTGFMKVVLECYRFNKLVVDLTTTSN